jgi:hypothetical protein
MTKIYVGWDNEEILSEKEMNKRHEEMLDLETDLGRKTFKEFYEYGGYNAVIEKLIEIITAKDKEEIINSLRERYGRYVEDQLSNIYEKVILD